VSFSRDTTFAEVDSFVRALADASTTLFPSL